MLLGCYRTGEASDPEIYLAAILRVLSGYPPDVGYAVSDPLTGLPAKQNWLPTTRELVAACEEIEGPRRRALEWEEQTRRQLAERRAGEHAKATKPTYEEIKDDLAASGIFIGDGRRRRTVDDVASVCAKLGITRAEFDALPDAATIGKRSGHG